MLYGCKIGWSLIMFTLICLPVCETMHSITMLKKLMVAYYKSGQFAFSWLFHVILLKYLLTDLYQSRQSLTCLLPWKLHFYHHATLTSVTPTPTDAQTESCLSGNRLQWDLDLRNRAETDCPLARNRINETGQVLKLSTNPSSNENFGLSVAWACAIYM